MNDSRRRFAPSAILSSEQLASISAYVQRLVDTGQIVGGVLHLQSGPGVLLQEAYGWADRESAREMRLDTIFRARSMTKPLVGTVVLMLMEQGLLELDAPVARYLPAFQDDAKRAITIRQLLSHTSGLTGAIYETIAGTEFTSLRQAVDHLGRHGGVSFAPGTGYEYSDVGSSTLGALVAELAGAPCEDVIAERILRPLEMSDSFCALVPVRDPRRGRIASTYQGAPNAWVRYWETSQPQVVPFFRASGGLYTTAGDYARFVRAIQNEGNLDGVHLLQPESVQLALTPHASRPPVGAEPGDAEEHYGLHWSLYTGFYGPVSSGTFGHGGSDGTMALVDPVRDLVVLYMTQSRGTATRPQVMRKIFGEMAASAG